MIPPVAITFAVVLAFCSPHAVPDRPPHAVAVTRPARTALHGSATWYAYRPGQAAAGWALRAFLGPRWRGMTVRVNGVPVRLTDFMASANHAKVIDLDAGLFRRICGPLSMGVCRVTVSR